MKYGTYQKGVLTSDLKVKQAGSSKTKVNKAHFQRQL